MLRRLRLATSNRPIPKQLSRSALDGPADLPSHEASWQDVDSLEEPNRAEEHQEGAHDS